MKMVDDLNDEIDDTRVSEQKMLKLMEDMQNEAMSIDTSNTTNNIGVNIQPKENDINYWDIDDIPTKYKLYPEGVKLSARPLKVIEVKKLTSITDDNADSVVNDILRKCIRGININDIYSADKLYLLLWLRANSFRDNRYVVDFNCPVCQKDSTYHFDINMVNIDYLSDNYNNDSVELSNGDNIKVKLLQIKDEIALSSFETKYGNLFKHSDDEIDEELLAISYMIDTVNSEKLSDVDRYRYLLTLSPEDFSIITTKLNELNVGIKSYMNVKCDKCGGESQVGITFHPDFFLPKFKSE